MTPVSWNQVQYENVVIKLAMVVHKQRYFSYANPTIHLRTNHEFGCIGWKLMIGEIPTPETLLDGNNADNWHCPVDNNIVINDYLP